MSPRGDIFSIILIEFYSYHQPMKQLVLLSLICITVSCDEAPRYQPITEDYCSSFSRPEVAGLSNYDNLIPDSTSGVYSLEEGDVSMAYRAWLTSAAEKTIDIQYFIFSADNIGLIAVDYLLSAANRGVKIRIIVDDILVEADADELLALDTHPNLEIKIYNPTTNIGKTFPAKIKALATDFKGFNQRMHNKTFIVDNKIAVTGGRNIADEYFDYDHEYNFRDRDVLLTGQVVGDLSNSFGDYWNNPLSVPIDELLDATEAQLNIDVKYEWLRQYACNPDNFWPEVRKNIERMPETFANLIEEGDMVFTNEVSFISDDPGKNEEDGLKGGGITTDSLVALVNNAQHSVMIQSPYLVTTELGQSLFIAATARGVDITILTNSLNSTDNLEAFSGYKRDRDKLLASGIALYEFRPDAAVRFDVMTGALQKKMDFTPIFGLHAKSMVIDQQIAVVGTFNLDPRSANLNTECITVIRDKVIASRMHQVMMTEIQPENAWHTTTDFNPDSEASIGKRISLWMRGIVPKSIL